MFFWKKNQFVDWYFDFEQAATWRDLVCWWEEGGWKTRSSFRCTHNQTRRTRRNRHLCSGIYFQFTVEYTSKLLLFFQKKRNVLMPSQICCTTWIFTTWLNTNRSILTPRLPKLLLNSSEHYDSFSFTQFYRNSTEFFAQTGILGMMFLPRIANVFQLECAFAKAQLRMFWSCAANQLAVLDLAGRTLVWQLKKR